MTYELLDSGNLRKLEKVGKYIISRPCPVAIWKPSFPKSKWDMAHFSFSRKGENKWDGNVPKDFWEIELNNVRLLIKPTDFGHLGAFFEHSFFFNFLRKKMRKKKNPKILNLFAYTGGVTFACAKAGANVCHVDASKPTIEWAKKNAKVNRCIGDSIRWIADDCIKFLKREIKRKNFYDGIILDPPTFGRGTKNEIFKIERDLYELLSLSRDILTKKNPLFMLFSCHTPGIDITVLKNISKQIFLKKSGELSFGNLFLKGKYMDIPTGNYFIWEKE